MKIYRKRKNGYAMPEEIAFWLEPVPITGEDIEGWMMEFAEDGVPSFRYDKLAEHILSKIQGHGENGD